MNPKLLSGLLTAALFSSASFAAEEISSSVPPSAEQSAAAVPNSTTAKSLELGSKLDFPTWRKAVDAEINALDEGREQLRRAELESFKVVLEKEEYKDPGGDHQVIKDALQNMKSRHPVQYNHVIKYVNEHGS